jgi:hypothetical protein
VASWTEPVAVHDEVLAVMFIVFAALGTGLVPTGYTISSTRLREYWVDDEPEYEKEQESTYRYGEPAFTLTSRAW